VIKAPYWLLSEDYQLKVALKCHSICGHHEGSDIIVGPVTEFNCPALQALCDIEFLAHVTFTCSWSTFSNPHKEFLTSSTNTHSSAGTRYPHGLTHNRCGTLAPLHKRMLLKAQNMILLMVYCMMVTTPHNIMRYNGARTRAQSRRHRGL